MTNMGQSYVAAKRFILLEKISEEFLERFSNALGSLKMGDPLEESTGVAPLSSKEALLPAVAYVLIWLYASPNHRLVYKNLDDGFIAHLTRRYLLTIALYFGAVLLSMLHALAGLALCVGLTLTYLLPPRKPRFHCNEEGKVAIIT